ncbi:hypothetical protein ACFUTV_43575 [Streptomyces sp. NPDC057298]|uniref:hypothetical protein n=1 Tax=Streptomyces sp. NPDC057298 TaxID=3346091 RepID=UPI00363A14BF
MKTYQRFARMKTGFAQDNRFLRGHAKRHQGAAPAKTSAKNTVLAKRNMARALNRHLDR